MELTVRKREHSLYVTLPSQVCKTMGIKEGSKVDIGVKLIKN